MPNKTADEIRMEINALVTDLNNYTQSKPAINPYQQLTPQIFESPFIEEGKSEFVRNEWIERYEMDGRIKFRLNNELRCRGSEYVIVKIPTQAFSFNLQGRQHLIVPHGMGSLFGKIS